MLPRFCLYGFLKNQQYFDPFLFLALRQKGLSFTAIGVLIGFRAISVSLTEIPAGAVADVLGRRRSMIASFLAYIGSFLLLGLCDQLAALFAAMFLFSMGTAFRTGTHKAMIFDWLSREGRLSEKTETYGRTRSWSKIGSAVSVVIAAAVVFFTDEYSSVFLLCAIPYSLNIINLYTYPAYLDGLPDNGLPGRENQKHSRHVFQMLRSALSQSLRPGRLRRLLVESMGFEGLYQSSKDYIQPLLQTACLALPIMPALAENRRVAVLVGLVYFVLYVLASVASRRAGRFAIRCGGDNQAGWRLWQFNLGAFAMIAVGALAGTVWLAVAAFVLLAVFQNLWRPILVSRVAEEAQPNQTATILSVESQAKSLFVAVAAPALGWAIDFVGKHGAEGLSDIGRFLPIAVLGIVVSGVMLIVRLRPA